MVIGFLLCLHADQAYSTAINVPFFKQLKPDLLIDALTRNFWTIRSPSFSSTSLLFSSWSAPRMR